MSAHGKLQEHRGDGRGDVIAIVAGRSGGCRRVVAERSTTSPRVQLMKRGEVG